MSEFEQKPNQEKPEEPGSKESAEPEKAAYLPFSLLHPASQSAAEARAIIGTIETLDEAGRPLVDFEGNPGSGVPARLAIAVSESELARYVEEKRPVLLQFEKGDVGLPIITGWIYDRPLEEREKTTADIVADGEDREIRVDGKRIVWDAEEEVVLRSGRSSIVLRKDGKIEIKGKYLLSRSSGVNKIKGGSIEIN